MLSFPSHVPGIELVTIRCSIDGIPFNLYTNETEHWEDIGNCVNDFEIPEIAYDSHKYFLRNETTPPWEDAWYHGIYRPYLYRYDLGLTEGVSDKFIEPADAMKIHHDHIVEYMGSGAPAPSSDVDELEEVVSDYSGAGSMTDTESPDEQMGTSHRNRRYPYNPPFLWYQFGKHYSTIDKPTHIGAEPMDYQTNTNTHTGAKMCRVVGPDHVYTLWRMEGDMCMRAFIVVCQHHTEYIVSGKARGQMFGELYQFAKPYTKWHADQWNAKALPADNRRFSHFARCAMYLDGLTNEVPPHEPLEANMKLTYSTKIARILATNGQKFHQPPTPDLIQQFQDSGENPWTGIGPSFRKHRWIMGYKLFISTTKNDMWSERRQDLGTRYPLLTEYEIVKRQEVEGIDRKFFSTPLQRYRRGRALDLIPFPSKHEFPPNRAMERYAREYDLSLIHI